MTNTITRWAKAGWLGMTTAIIAALAAGFVITAGLAHTAAMHPSPAAPHVKAVHVTQPAAVSFDPGTVHLMSANVYATGTARSSAGMLQLRLWADGTGQGMWQPAGPGGAVKFDVTWARGSWFGVPDSAVSLRNASAVTGLEDPFFKLTVPDDSSYQVMIAGQPASLDLHLVPGYAPALEGVTA